MQNCQHVIKIFFLGKISIYFYTIHPTPPENYAHILNVDGCVIIL